jgi:CheY-like chemotaxis protein
MTEKNKKVLIVDDSIFARISIKKLIKERNYELLEAENGEIALNKIYSEKPDLVITDNLMPVMNGMELIQKMREDNIETPVVVISANQQEKTKEKFMELDVVGVIKKSPDKAEFLSLLDKAFQSVLGE